MTTRELFWKRGLGFYTEQDAVVLLEARRLLEETCSAGEDVE